MLSGIDDATSWTNPLQIEFHMRNKADGVKVDWDMAKSAAFSSVEAFGVTLRADYHLSGVYYFIISGPISIQGKYLPTKFTNGLAVTKMVAIGGPVLKGNKLVTGPLAATWNGAPILGQLGSHFRNQDF